MDGEWVLCFTRNSEGSPSLQKVRTLCDKTERGITCNGIHYLVNNICMYLTGSAR